VSSGTKCCILGSVVPDVSMEHSAFTAYAFEGQDIHELGTT
jgi:hypothetical protein